MMWTPQRSRMLVIQNLPRALSASTRTTTSSNCATQYIIMKPAAAPLVAISPATAAPQRFNRFNKNSKLISPWLGPLRWRRQRARPSQYYKYPPFCMGILRVCNEGISPSGTYAKKVQYNLTQKLEESEKHRSQYSSFLRATSIQTGKVHGV